MSLPLITINFFYKFTWRTCDNVLATFRRIIRIPGMWKCVGGLYSSSKGEGITRRKTEKKERTLVRFEPGAGCSPPMKLRGRRKARKRELHLFSPPCSKQKRDDLCGAGAAAPRRGRILAFSSAPSRVARVAECVVAFSSSGAFLRREGRDASFSDDMQLPAIVFFFSSSLLCRTFPREAG